MAYRTEIQVRFGDVDRAGIVYYPVIFHYLHIAQEDFFADYVGIPYHRLIEEEGLGFPTVHDSTDFYKPLRYGDTIEITIHISNVGESSATFEFRLRKKGTDQLLAMSSEVKVAINMQTWEKTVIPEKYREILMACREELKTEE